jgi:hypothetical protein
MQDDKMHGRYRSLVLSHLYILARKNRISVAKLPPDELERLGVRIIREKAHSATFAISVPPAMENGQLEKAIADLEAERRENSHLFPAAPLRKRAEGFSGWKRQDKAPKKRNRRAGDGRDEPVRLPDIPMEEDLADIDGAKDTF